MRFADCLGLCRMRVDQLRHLRWQGLPIDYQLSLCHQFSDPVADEMSSQHFALGPRDQFHRGFRVENRAAAVSCQVVGDGPDVGRAEVLAGVAFVPIDRGNLGLAVGDAWHRSVIDGSDRPPGQMLGDEDSLRTPDLC